MRWARQQVRKRRRHDASQRRFPSSAEAEPMPAKEPAARCSSCASIHRRTSSTAVAALARAAAPRRIAAAVASACAITKSRDPASQTKSLCKAGAGCVQCLSGTDCTRILGSGTLTKSLHAGAESLRRVHRQLVLHQRSFPGNGPATPCLASARSVWPTPIASPGARLQSKARRQQQERLCRVHPEQPLHRFDKADLRLDAQQVRALPGRRRLQTTPSNCKTNADSTLNQCVECLSSNDCKTLTSKPICDTTKTSACRARRYRLPGHRIEVPEGCGR